MGWLSWYGVEDDVTQDYTQAQGYIKPGVGAGARIAGLVRAAEAC